MVAPVRRGILDTSVLIAGDVITSHDELAISVVSLAELRFGVLVAKNADARGRRLARLSALERRFDALPVDDVVADEYALLAARLTERGRTPRAMDLLIAATARAHAATLYTRNAGDLRGLDDLVDIASV